MKGSPDKLRMMRILFPHEEKSKLGKQKSKFGEIHEHHRKNCWDLNNKNSGGYIKKKDIWMQLQKVVTD